MHTPAQLDRHSCPVMEQLESVRTRMFEPASIVVLAAVAIEIAAAASTVDPSSIFSDPARRAYCLIGAGLGALMAVFCGPKDKQNTGPRALAAKFFASFIGGVMLTPLLFRWCGWPMDADMLIGVTGIMAFLTIGSVSLVLPKFFRWLDRRSDKYLGDEDDSKKQN